jgi:hypothetical protein
MEEDFKDRLDIMYSKQDDYADEDGLSNFKRMGKAIEALSVNEMPPELAYCMTLILLKIDRAINLIRRGATPKNESLDDTFLDLMNYLDLFKALFIERSENVKS